MSAAVVSELGHRAARFATALERQLERLRGTPVTVEQLILGTVEHGVDFSELDALLRATAAAGDETFEMSCDVHSMRAWHETLTHLATRCAPYRAVSKPRRAAA